MNTVAAVPTLVTCHANADFDAFAAMIAARRLYPGCCLLFPGTQDRGLQAIVQDEALRKKYNFVELTDIDFAAIGRLVAVDTRQRERLSHVAPLLDREDMQVEVWDHHPDTPNDIRCTASYMEIVGSVTALLVLRLKEENIALEAEEATLLGLGIYGDTGSFTYSSTSAKDFMAAAWLLSQGMDVNRIDELAAHELTSLHVRALNALLESSQTYLISGESVVVAEVDLEHYLGDFAYLAQQVMEMEKFEILFAIGRMDDRIQVVARSRSKAVDVGAVCAAIGGGGHAYAASASVRSMTLAEVRDAIVRALYSQTERDKAARDYMSSPAVGIEANRTISEADMLMLHFGLKAVPVFEPGTRRCVGLLDAQTASRAGVHGLGNSLVDEYMVRRISMLPPDAPLSKLSAIIVDGRQRLVPIVENDAVVGVVTRTDLINLFASEPESLRGSSSGGKTRNLAKLMRDRLPRNVQHLLETAGAIGRELDMRVYVAGGFVRDLLLGKPNNDVDLVAEGRGNDIGSRLAHRLAEVLGGRVREHPKFLTCVVIYEEDGKECRVDVATARLEYYEHPAALPTVEASSIKMDLVRRDFSMNALAVRLDSTPFGQLVDFFGGQRDLRDGVIRVLHTLSFVEDPTRCLRAVRFAQRYGFRIAQASEKLIKNALSLKLFERLSPARLFHEFAIICEEPTATECLFMLDSLGILAAIHPLLQMNPARRTFLRRLGEIFSWYRMLYFEEVAEGWIVFVLGMCNNFNFRDASACYTALGLPPQRKQEIMQGRETMRTAATGLTRWLRTREDGGEARVSALDALLEPVSVEGLLALMAQGGEDDPQRRVMSRYITQWRREKADITGKDLIALGLRPGPQFGEILRAVRRAKLDGEVGASSEQAELAVRLSEQTDGRAGQKGPGCV